MNATATAILESSDGEPAVLEHVQAHAAINDLLAEIVVSQRYRNPDDRAIEANYTFPLPVDGVLLGVEFEIGDRRLAGRFLDKSKAENRYEDAIVDGDAAVLVEQTEPGLYTASVGNLMPGETATVRFHYGLLLRWNGDRVRFAMPSTIAPRYGDPASATLQPHQVPGYAIDAERSFHLDVTVRGMLQDARFDSPSHGIRLVADAEETRIQPDGRPAMDRDFVLEARASVGEPAGAVSAQDFDEWMALASFRPGARVQREDRRHSIKVLVDCSGSMAGDSMAQARVALKRIVDELREGDHFEIIAFGNGHRSLFGHCARVSEATKTAARCFVRDLDANMGGTEVGTALDTAYAVPGSSRSVQDLLLITDGQVWESEPLITLAKESGHRVFTVGVGSAVAEAFVRRLAEATGGASELVAPREDMADRIHRQFERIYAPHAESAAVHWPETPIRTTPRSIETVYAGDTVHAFAWFREKPVGRAILNVAWADGSVTRHEAVISAVEPGAAKELRSEEMLPPAIARIAAARVISEMEGNDGAGKELALRYQLLSKWTNCVAVHVRAAAERAEDLPKIVKVPHVIAAGWHGMGTVASAAELLSEVRFRAPSFGSMDRKASMRSSMRRVSAMQFSRAPQPVFAGISAGELARRLNSLSMPPFPSIDDLRGTRDSGPRRRDPPPACFEERGRGRADHHVLVDAGGVPSWQADGTPGAEVDPQGGPVADGAGSFRGESGGGSRPLRRVEAASPASPPGLIAIGRKPFGSLHEAAFRAEAPSTGCDARKQSRGTSGTGEIGSRTSHSLRISAPVHDRGQRASGQDAGEHAQIVRIGRVGSAHTVGRYRDAEPCFSRPERCRHALPPRPRLRRLAPVRAKAFQPPHLTGKLRLEAHRTATGRVLPSALRAASDGQSKCHGICGCQRVFEAWSPLRRVACAKRLRASARKGAARPLQQGYGISATSPGEFNLLAVSANCDAFRIFSAGNPLNGNFRSSCAGRHCILRPER